MAALVVVTAKMLQPLDHQEHLVKEAMVVWVAEQLLTKLLVVVEAQAHKVVMVWLVLLALAGLAAMGLRQVLLEAA